MSILETPRINFKGQISWDPIVTNNYTAMYDEASADNTTNQYQTAEEFRKGAASKSWVIDNGNWNPQGTHRSVFFDTAVSTTETEAGILEDDPFIKSPVSFKGMLVDCEPYGSTSSQLFFDTLTVGIQGGYQISAKRSNRMTARYINFARLIPRSVYPFAASGASVNWQTTFHKEDISISAFDSPGLNSLTKALEEPDVLGLTFRFNAYSTHYYGAADANEINQLSEGLVENLANGGFQPNPARSQIVGSIGLWRKGEPIHEPGDRALITQDLPNDSKNPPICSSWSRVNHADITLDLSNAIPETDLEYNKYDYGALELVTVADDGKGAVTSLAQLSYRQYDKSIYDKTSGIIRIPLNADQIKAVNTGVLKLRSPATPATPYLVEQLYRAIPSDPNLYLDQGKKTQAHIHLLYKGKPAGSDVKISLVPNGDSVNADIETRTNAHGIAEINVEGITGGVTQYVVSQGEIDPQDNQINPPVTTYMTVRVLPSDSSLHNLTPSWENVYENCLKDWYAMAPCMDNWLDLNDEFAVKSNARLVMALTHPDNFERFLFMPVTRDMSAGKRRLLHRFLKNDVTSQEKAGTETSDLATLSKSLRSPQKRL